MLHLSSGARLEGDDELVYRAVDLEQAGGDGLYVADIAETTELPEDVVHAVVQALVDQQVLVAGPRDDQLGARYTTGPAA